MLGVSFRIIQLPVPPILIKLYGHDSAVTNNPLYFMNVLNCRRQVLVSGFRDQDVIYPQTSATGRSRTKEPYSKRR